MNEQLLPYRDLAGKDAGFPENSSDQDWLREKRRLAFQYFQKTGFPTRKFEAWKYAALEPLLSTAFIQPDFNAECEHFPREISDHLISFSEIVRFVLWNGAYSQCLSAEKNLPKGVILEALSQTLRENPERLKPYLAMIPTQRLNPFAALNTAFFGKGIFLYVPENTVVDIPIHLVFAESGRFDLPTVYYPRLVLVIGANAKVKIVLDHMGCGENVSLVNTVSEVFLGKNASLNCVNLQQAEKDTYQMLTQFCALSEGSRLRQVSFSRGGAMIREEMNIEFEGEGAAVDLRGLALLSEKSRVFNHTVTHHKAPRCESRQIYKNILAGHSEAEFNSLVHVSRGAVKTRSDQQNRSLLLSETAKAYSRPQLKIDTDDVQCAHGAATGQLDDKEIFYLKSRGFSEREARFLLTYGFAREVLNTIDFIPVRHSLDSYVRHEIGEILKQG